MSEQSRGSNAVSLNLLPGGGLQQFRQRREAATDADVLENGDELFVVLTIDLGQFHAACNTLVP